MSLDMIILKTVARSWTTHSDPRIRRAAGEFMSRLMSELDKQVPVEPPGCPEPEPARRHEVERRLYSACKEVKSCLNRTSIRWEEEGVLARALEFADANPPEPDGSMFEGVINNQAGYGKDLDVLVKTPLKGCPSLVVGDRVRVTILPVKKGA